MNEFKEAREAYLDTPVPAELADRVQAGRTAAGRGAKPCAGAPARWPPAFRC